MIYHYTNFMDKYFVRYVSPLALQGDLEMILLNFEESQKQSIDRNINIKS